MVTTAMRRCSDAGVACPELDIAQERMSLAVERDSRVRELERQHVATWSEMAELCQAVEEQQDWKLLGFPSYHQWLLDAAPQSRSAMYAARGLLAELKEIPIETLRQIPLGSARTLAMVPRARRGETIVLAATRARPKAFREAVVEKFPDLHIEADERMAFRMSRSQRKVVEGALLMVSVIEAGEVVDEPILADEEALTLICKGYLEENRERYEKIKRHKSPKRQ